MLLLQNNKKMIAITADIQDQALALPIEARRLLTSTIAEVLITLPRPAKRLKAPKLREIHNQNL